MEKRKNIIVSLGQSLVLVGFSIAALASSSARDTISSPEFKEGFERGWEIGRSFSSNTTPETQSQNPDSIYFNQPEIALNSESLNNEIPL